MLDGDRRGEDLLLDITACCWAVQRYSMLNKLSLCEAFVPFSGVSRGALSSGGKQKEDTQ